MRRDICWNLSESSEFQQVLQARTSRPIHVVTWLFVSLVVAAGIWSHWTQAQLVVRGTGRLRPLGEPMKVVNNANGEVLGSASGGRVVSVHFREGDEVTAGQILVEFDTTRIDQEIAKRQRTVSAAERESSELRSLSESLRQQQQTAADKGNAELRQVEEELAQAQEKRLTNLRTVQAQLDQAELELNTERTLMKRKATTPFDLKKKKESSHAEATARWEQARLPVESGKLAVARQNLATIERDFAVRRQELTLKIAAKEHELAQAQGELVTLRGERSHTTITAPLSGVVTSGEIRVGDVLERGKPIAEIAPRDGLQFVAVVGSDEMAHLRTDLPVQIKLDAFDHQKYGTLPGVVSFVTADSQIAAAGSKDSKPQYTVKIRLTASELRRGEHHGQLKIGLAGQAEVVTAERSLLSVFVKRIRQSISLN